MKTKMVRYTLDLHSPPPLTAEQKKRLAALAARPESEIDYSDIPPLPRTGWRRVSDLIPAENKKQITLRLDADVIEFFRGTGRRYQSRINAALRDYVNAQKKSA